MCEEDGMEEWKECTLSNLGTIVGGATPSTKDSSNYENGSIAWITPKDLSTHTERFISHGERNITEKGLKSCSAQLMPQNSILFTSRAPIGYIAIAKNEVCTNQGFKSIVPNKDTDFMFLYYLLKYNKDNIENLGSGTTFKEVSGSTMKSVPVKVPPLPTQQKIAAILSSLDDKIELNNKINTNLEQQAGALFKNWFIDFEPFGGKMPEEWKEKTLDSFCSIFTGRKNANASVENGKYKFFTCSPNVLPIDSFIFDGDAIIISGNGAYTGRTRFYSGKFDLYQRTYACTMKKDQNQDYIFILYWIIKFVLSKKIMGGTHGSAIPYIVMDDIAKFVINYDKKLFDDLSKIMKSYVLQIQENENQNEKLAELRDTLLPKLMNGDLETNHMGD